MMYRARCRSTGSARALTITSASMPAGSPMVIAIVGRYSITVGVRVERCCGEVKGELRNRAARFLYLHSPPGLFLIAPLEDGNDRLGQHVHLEVERPPRRAVGKHRDLKCGRDQGDFKAVPAY